MKQESLAGYHRPDTTGKPGEQGEGEEVDAAMAWCDRILERRADGEWVARGITSQSSPTPRMTDSDPEESEGMISWLSSHGITFSSPESDFNSWSSEIEITLSSIPPPLIHPIDSFPPFTPISSGSEYKRQIQICREAIRQGESYELTLTTKFTSKPPPSTDPLSLYLRLRSINPAYYSTYLSFPSLRTGKGEGLAVISSSPERFLKIEKGVVEMMPIKGTRARVKPGTCICQETGRECEGGEKCEEVAKGEDARRGEELRLDPKERAENLMVSFVFHTF
jgi:para-aminobenzoate synthetase